jgi:hypothetical protein
LAPFRSAKGDFTLTPAHVTRATGNLNHAAICKVKAMWSAHTFDVAEITSWRQTLATTALVADDLMTRASTDRIIPCSETDLRLTQDNRYNRNEMWLFSLTLCSRRAYA